MLNKAMRLYRLSRQRAAEGHLPLPQQLREMLQLRLTRGVGPAYYHTGGFWQRDMPWDDKTEHASAAEHRRLVRALNPPNYQKLSQNKFAEKALLSLYGIPTAPFLGRLQQKDGLDYRGNTLSNAAELDALLAARDVQHAVFKDPEGHGGFGIQIIKLRRNGSGNTPNTGDSNSRSVQCALLTSEDYQPLQTFCDDVLKLDSGSEWLIEEYLPQHPDMAALNPSSLNGLRIWVRHFEKQPPQIITAYARIGRAGMFVDEATSGGMIAPVNLDSGVLEPARDAFAERRMYDQHPDHGAPIAGHQVPLWPQAQALAVQVLRAFPMLNFAGLDVAFTPQQPVIVELNVSPDREAAAYTGCATRRFFKDVL